MSTAKKGKKSIPEALKKRLSQIHVLSHNELRKLFAVITDLRDRAMFLVAYRHGLRASEVALLTISDVDLKKLKISVRRIGRGASADHDLQKDEHQALQRYLQAREGESVILFLGSRGKAITRRGLDWLMKIYCEKAKLPSHKRHFHALKHSIATHLLGAGADLRFVHEWLGHTMIQSTAIYLYLVKAPASGKAKRQDFFPAILT